MADTAAAIEALRARGAERFDPVGLRFIEGLARRAVGQTGPARKVLELRLAQVLADFGSRFDEAERDARAALAQATARFPEAAATLAELCAGGDFGALQRLLGRLQARRGGEPLGELLAHLDQHRTDVADVSEPIAAARGQPRGELKSVRVFRRTWSKLRVDQQLSEALAQAPKDAGPLNSHALVLQSLRVMRDICPEYLEQFVGYIDALLWLDQTGSAPPRPAAAAVPRGTAKRRRTP